MRMCRMVLAVLVIGVLAAGCEAPEKKPVAKTAKAEPANAPAEETEAPAEKIETTIVPPDQEVVLEAEDMSLFDAEIKNLPGARGGKAVLLGSGSSIVDTVVTLSKGKYEVVVYVQAPDGEHDAFYLTFANGIRQRLFPGECRKVVAAKAIILKIAKKKPSKIVLKPAETGMYIDRVVIRPIK